MKKFTIKLKSIHKMKRIISIILVAMSFASQAQNVTTKGTEFWLTYVESLDPGANYYSIYSVIISSDVNTSGTITIPATGFSFGFNVTANHATEVTLPQNIYNPQGDEDIFDFGIKITSADPVNVYTYHHRMYFTDASIVLPVTELSDQYLVTAHKDYMNINKSEFVVEATQDSTAIEIIPSVLTLGFRPPGVPFTILLNEAQVFQLQSYGDLTGTSVRSIDPQKKIAVFGGAKQARINCNAADNTLYDEVYPVANAGTTFITVPFLTFFNQGYDVFRFMATQDSTTVGINTASVFLAVRGQHFDTLLSVPAFVNATKPIFATQFKTSQNCSIGPKGDPSMLNLTPVSLKKKTTVFKSLDGPGFTLFDSPQHYVNIITGTNATGLLTMDGNTLATFQTVPANPAYSYTVVANITAGEHIIQSDSGFNAYAYGIGYYEAYTFHLGYDEFLTTGINGLNQNEIKFSVSNPVTDNIKITLRKTYKNLKTELYNVLGSLVFYKNFKDVSSTLQLNVSGLNKGIYFLTLTIDGERTVKKIVKE